MAELTNQQLAAVLFETAVMDFQEHFLENESCTVRFTFPELTTLLYHPFWKDSYIMGNAFESYIHKLYRLSLADLRINLNGTFEDDFKSLKLVTHLFFIKSTKIDNLFKQLQN